MQDELISAAELARRLGINPSYITKQKKAGKLVGCMRGKKFYQLKTIMALGRDVNNPTYSNNPQSTKKTSSKKETLPKKKDETTKQEPKTYDDSDARTQLQEILAVINDSDTTTNKALLDGLKAKASILKEYFLAKNEEIKNRKLEENLFTKDEVIQVLSAAMSMIRNQMINMPNNYAVNLENADKITIKEYVTDDINKILSDLQEVGKQFEKK